MVVDCIADPHDGMKLPCRSRSAGAGNIAPPDFPGFRIVLEPGEPGAGPEHSPRLWGFSRGSPVQGCTSTPRVIPLGAKIVDAETGAGNYFPQEAARSRGRTVPAKERKSAMPQTATAHDPDVNRNIRRTREPEASRAPIPGIIEQMLDRADIRIDGLRPWDIRVHNPRLFDRIISQGSLGLGESYMEGWWDCDAIDEFFCRILRARKGFRPRLSPALLFSSLKARYLNLQTPVLSKGKGKVHYELGNDLYRAMLDKRMVYTCGYWKGVSNLDEAQEAKLDLTCRKLQLEPGMRVLDIGCGWGSFARFAADRYGVEVVGITVAENQVELGREMCKGLPVEILLRDYREMEGQFDRVVSLGMFEHVGYKNYREYMRVAARCLKSGGLFLLHTVGDNRSEIEFDPWMDRYIFPNALIPSIAQIGAAMENIFVMEDWHNLSTDYDRTLCAWHANFQKAWPELSKSYDEHFRRMWRYYLLQCAGGFRARKNQLWQIVLSKDRMIQYQSVR
ncbi:MAG: cyclopropane-fatty-acyl-phospholipid synthase [Fibrobacteres bacterium]|nr:cyclopropane-fatty-acyl-phospholipid synthase [Fibrobacterota bacterium]